MKLSIIVPAYNEEKTIRDVITKLAGLVLPVEHEIVVVDDGSSDSTGKILMQLAVQKVEIKVIFNKTNKGKGHAVREGIANAKGDIIVIQDSDLEYNPDDIQKVIRPILDNRAVAVFGSRFMGGVSHHKTVNYYGNRLLTMFTNILYGTTLTDMETGYKAFTHDIYDELVLKENRFGIEPELTARLIKLGAEIVEVPISYNPRNYAEGKKINWRDGVYAVAVLLKIKLWPDRLAYNFLRNKRVAFAVNQIKYRGSVLDIGCGDMAFLSSIKAQTRIGLDTLYGSKVNGVLGFADSSFDFVTMFAMLEHLDNPEPILREIKRVLKPTGKLVLTTPKASVHWLMQLLWPDTHKRYYDQGALQHLVAPHFRVVEYKEFEFGLNQYMECAPL